MTKCNRRTIHPITRSRSAKKKSLTSASPPSTSSTRRARLRRRKATSSSPLVAVAAVAAVAAVVAAGAVGAVVAAAVAAVAASVGVAAAYPGALAASAKRGYPPRVISANNHGRVRHRRPGLCMCPCGVARGALGSLPHHDHAEFLPNNVRTPIGLRNISDPRKTLADRRSRQGSCSKP